MNKGVSQVFSTDTRQMTTQSIYNYCITTPLRFTHSNSCIKSYNLEIEWKFFFKTYRSEKE